MSDLTIVTNNVPRLIIDEYELTADERAEFGYIDWSAVDRGEASASFFRYRGQLYDLDEFMRMRTEDPSNPHRAWDGYYAKTFFSGILVRFDPDDVDCVIVGRYCA